MTLFPKAITLACIITALMSLAPMPGRASETSASIWMSIIQGGAVRPQLNADNPKPIVTLINPSTAAAGSGTLTITITGSSFLPTSLALLGNNPIATNFVSSTQLTATVAYYSLKTACTYPVSVYSPTPGGGRSGSLPFTVFKPNNAPYAVDDSAGTSCNTAVKINVLANDWDFDTDDSISVSSVSQPQNGTTTINTDATITYMPKLSFEGTDSFTYTIADRQGVTATASVKVTVGRDVEPPAFDSVNAYPTIVAAGDAILVDVYVTDNIGVTSVKANGVSLYDYGEGYWSGSVSASAALGWNTIHVEARDAADNYSTGSTAYRTVPVVGINGRSIRTPLMNVACENFLFVVYGVVQVSNDHLFTICDGSMHPLNVEASGHNLKSGVYARVRGRLFNYDPGNVYIYIYDPPRDIAILRNAPAI